MEFLERDLEENMLEQEFIMVNNKEILLIDSQVNLNGYRVDLMGIDNKNDIYLFELKKSKIDGNALSQLLHYIYYAKSYSERKIYGVLVGTSIDNYTDKAIKVLENIYFLQSTPTFIFDDFNPKDKFNGNNENCDKFNIITKNFNYYDHPLNKKGDK